MSTLKGILIWAGFVVVAGGIYVWLFGVQTATALIVRYKFRGFPDVAETPAPLSDLSISTERHKVVSYFGYEFELPWDNVDEAKDKTFGTVHVTYFRSGDVFWFSTFPPRDFVKEVMKTEKLTPKDFDELYGHGAAESDYTFHEKMLEITPSEITPFISRTKAVSSAELLLEKAISMPKADSGIFSVETREFRGFQFENPQTRPSRITVELFSADGGIDVMFLQKAGVPEISQREVNRIIQSIHKIPLPKSS